MVSCIITTYKRPVEILKRAVDSILNQIYTDIELIIVNDAPAEKELSDEIGKMISECKAESSTPITYIVHDKNMGACAARNIGIKAAKGEFVAFLDDDDEWLSDKLLLQVQKIENTNIALVYCDHYDKYDDKQVLISHKVKILDKIDGDFYRLLCMNYIGSTSFPLIRKSVLLELGGFNTELKSSQDYDLWLRIVKNHTIAYIDKPLVRYYHSTESISSNYDNIEQGTKFVFDEYKNEYKSHRRVYNYWLNFQVIAALKRRQYSLAFKTYVKAVLAKPFSSCNFIIVSRLFHKLIGRKK